MKIGIYIIRCLQEELVYIGSSNNISKRCGEHIRTLNKGEHHCYKLQKSWNLYDQDSFIFNILEETSNLLLTEQIWLDKYWPNVYNSSPNAFNPMRSKNIDISRKLNEKDVVKIKKLLIEGDMTQKAIADRFGVKPGIISKIKTGKGWKHIGPDISTNKGRRLTNEQIKEIELLYKNGMNAPDIAYKFDKHRDTIYKLTRRKGW